MFHKINSQTALTLVSLDDAKIQCRITAGDTDHDAALTMAIAQASELAQSYVNKLLSTGDVSAAWNGYKHKITLWGGNVSSVDSLIGKDSLGNSTVIEDFNFNLITQELTIPKTYGALIEFAVAYTITVDSVSAIIKAGVLHLTEYLFNNRSDIALGLTVTDMPLTATKILDAERHYIV